MFGKDDKKAKEPPPPSPPPPLPTHRGTPSIFRRFSTTGAASSEPPPSVSVIPTELIAVSVDEPSVHNADIPDPSDDPAAAESFSPSFLRRLTSDIAANPNSPSLIRRLNDRLQAAETSKSDDTVEEPPLEPVHTEEVPAVKEVTLATPSLFRRVSESLWSSPRSQRKETVPVDDQPSDPSEPLSEQVEVEFAPKSEEKKGYRTLTRSMSNLSLFKERKRKRRKKKEEEEYELNKEDIGFNFLGSAKFVNNRYKDTSMVVYKGWKKQVIAKRKDNREIQANKRTKLSRHVSFTTLRLKTRPTEIVPTETDSSLTTYNIEKLVAELPQDENYSVSMLKKTEDKPGCEVM